jgi:hypothetical protein
MSSDGPITSLARLYAALERHDWFYEMSDDHGVYEAGRVNWKRLVHAAVNLPKGGLLLLDYSIYIGNPKATKPKLEDYL